ncbi:DNA (cytosine-5-)-methyltransferase [Actinomadura opuntiae]|uniref:DNA (cytosine-5-)-methyltransferase n=1 Tax=Actinomadura sp. OS1-43 TaxID=604315 RepID=UPI00255A9D9D|nr:DNA (cytosine-5-)-methyltransferase [Actinomadura sp. OS1-43]MDL4816935.1 DNA (cytosine-5-)-methyltransferase [Actinomadura sp. OS1-43]
MDTRASGESPATVQRRDAAIGLDRGAIVDRIDELLEVTYRSASLGNVEDPVAEAIYILLSVQTREAMYQRVFQELRARFPTWNEVLEADRAELEEILRPAGFQARRAEYIQSFLTRVQERNAQRGMPGRISLDYLRELKDREVLQELKSLPGLGPKTARCIMTYSLGRDVFAVDTHVSRIFHRIGLVARGKGKVDHALYEEIVPARSRQRLHVNLIHHGRAICGSSKPACRSCPLISFCAEGQRSIERGSEPVAVELFAGAGGLALGFERAGFRVAVAVEMDKDAAQTHRANHPGTVVLERDAREITADHLRAVAPSLGEVAAVIGGPPCQGYSVAGKRDPGDAKNALFKEQVRIASELEARFVVIENVLGMRNIKGVSFHHAVEDELRSKDYHPDHRVVKASSYGVPQLRSRIIFTAQLVRKSKGHEPVVPPGGYCGDRRPGCRCGRPFPPTVTDVLDRPGLLPLGPGVEAEYMMLRDGRVLLNGSTMNHGQKVIDKIAGIQPGKGPISYRRLHKDLARTIVAGHRALPVHPVLNRTISVREAARIQGFPDGYVFCGSRGKQPLQVANAVPPALGQAVAGELMRIIEERPGTKLKRAEQDLCGPPLQLLIPRSEAPVRRSSRRARKAAG